jgi:putative transposase
MNSPKCNEYDYINFLMASPKIFSCTEAEKVQPDRERMPSHDSINRLLYRLSSDTEVLRQEAARFTDLKHGVLISDDSTLDKPYAKKIQMVTYHRSGKHHSVVKGINLVTLLRTDGDTHIPCDYRIYRKEADGKTKNEHFTDMLHKAAERGACPEYVLFDSRYSGVENL